MRLPPLPARPFWSSTVIAIAVPLGAPAPAPAQVEGHQPLWPGDPPGPPPPAEKRETFERGGVFHVYRPSYRVYAPEPGAADSGASVVVFPGGGYGMLATGWEGEPIAQWFAARGITAVLVHYRVSSNPDDAYQHPVPLLDAQRGVRVARDIAGRNRGSDAPGPVGVIGFSAGGHLAATVSNLHGEEHHEPVDAIDRLSARPDFTVLVYPVISMRDGLGHPGSRTRLLGESPDAEMVDALSLETRVSERTPPAFLVHGTDDSVVPPRHSTAYYDACCDHGVSAELHLFAHGPHGFAMQSEADLPVTGWPDLLEAWLDRQPGATTTTGARAVPGE